MQPHATSSIQEFNPINNTWIRLISRNLTKVFEAKKNRNIL